MPDTNKPGATCSTRGGMCVFQKITVGVLGLLILVSLINWLT